MAKQLPRSKMRGNPNRPSSVSNYYQKVCGCDEKKARKEWKANGVRANEVRGSSRRALTAAETKRLLSALRQNSGAAADALKFALYTGLRVSEVVQAKYGDIKKMDWFGTPRFCLHVLGKGQKWRWVPLDRRAERALAEVGAAASGWIFKGRAAGHVSAVTVQALCRRIGEEVPELSFLTPHVLRHTYATTRVRECADPEELKAALGHDSINTTLVYVGKLR